MAFIKLDDALQVCSEAEEWYIETNEQHCAVVADDIYQQIANIPTADVVEVKHGEWICLEAEIGYFACSECDHRILRAECNYCPHCGAKMDGGVKSEQE